MLVLFYEDRHKNNETVAVSLFLYIIKKNIFNHPPNFPLLTLKTVAYYAPTVNSNGADRFLMILQELCRSCFYPFYLLKIGFFWHGFDLWLKKKSQGQDQANKLGKQKNLCFY